MISCLIDGGRFNFRVAGVCIHDGHLLIHRGERETSWSLLGGRVEMMEASETALVREMREELDTTIEVQRLLWVVENFFVWESDQPAHELGLYYLFTLPDDSPRLDTSATFDLWEGQMHLIFRWQPLATLSDIVLYPIFLQSAIHRLPDRVEHIVNRE